MIIVSGCLAGLKCRYDGQARGNEKVIKLVEEGKALPVCPEQLGGLPTPRPCCEILAGRAVTRQGEDVSEHFIRGAEEGTRLAELVGAEKALLKARSPSCGAGEIYDGTFSGKLTGGDGFFAAMLKAGGLEVETL